MIFDKIENFETYQSVHKRFKDVSHFFKITDVLSLKPGKHLIDGNDIYAMVFEYDTHDGINSKLEGHKKYIDIQYMVIGNEKINVSKLLDQSLAEKYNVEKDYHLFTNNSKTSLHLNEGMFIIFYPDDLHMPELKIDKPEKVKKIVIKVKV